MSIDRIIEVGVAAVILIGLGMVVVRHRVLNKHKFLKQWKDIQGLCRTSETWPYALVNADRLLDRALKRRHMKGKTMGERLVSAQRRFSNNDTVWFAHKLRKQLEENPDQVTLKQDDVKEALVGIRQALKDLGALE